MPQYETVLFYIRKLVIEISKFSHTSSPRFGVKKFAPRFVRKGEWGQHEVLVIMANAIKAGVKFALRA